MSFVQKSIDALSLTSPASYRNAIGWMFSVLTFVLGFTVGGLNPQTLLACLFVVIIIATSIEAMNEIGGARKWADTIRSRWLSRFIPSGPMQRTTLRPFTGQKSTSEVSSMTAHCEARFTALSKKKDKDGNWISVTFQVHPDDFPLALFEAPLGQRYMLALEGITDQEEPANIPATKVPEKTKREWTELSPAQQAGILCNDKDFQAWLQVADKDAAAEAVRDMCGVGSRSELCENKQAGAFWEHIVSSFRAQQLEDQYEDNLGRDQ